MGFSRVFRSRWAALLWAAGIVWTAIDVAGAASGVGTPPAPANQAAPASRDATGEAIDAADLAVLANAGG